MSEITERLTRLREQIGQCERRYGRVAGSVELVAVSKRQPASAIHEALAAGQRKFAENYLQEALTKQRVLATNTIEWHFIGPIQSNKTAAIAEHFDWVHTLDRARIAERLNQQRPPSAAPLEVLIQVNISAEQSKHGIAPAALPALIAAVRALPRLRLRGLMALPAPHEDFHAQRQAFARLAALASADDDRLDVLSMGTSDDFEAAIAEGATLIRLGTAVFGPRQTGA